MKSFDTGMPFLSSLYAVSVAKNFVTTSPWYVWGGVLPSGFVKTRTCIFMDGHQNNLAQLFPLMTGCVNLKFHPGSQGQGQVMWA